MELHEFAEQDVDAAVTAGRDPAAARRVMDRLSPSARKALKGGVLMLHVLRVSRSGARWEAEGSQKRAQQCHLPAEATVQPAAPTVQPTAPGRGVGWQATAAGRLEAQRAGGSRSVGPVCLQLWPAMQPPLPAPLQVRVWLAGESKRTLSVKGKGPNHTIDQEVRLGALWAVQVPGALVARWLAAWTLSMCQMSVLPPRAPQLEFVLDGDRAQQPHQIEVEVWDVHWRNGGCGRPAAQPVQLMSSNHAVCGVMQQAAPCDSALPPLSRPSPPAAFQGRCSVPFPRVRDDQLWRGTLDLQERQVCRGWGRDGGTPIPA